MLLACRSAAFPAASPDVTDTANCTALGVDALMDMPVVDTKALPDFTAKFDCPVTINDGDVRIFVGSGILIEAAVELSQLPAPGYGAYPPDVESKAIPYFWHSKR